MKFTQCTNAYGLFLATVLSTLAPLPAHAGIDPFVGQISWVSFGFAPKNWALCNGQLLSIQQNTALFSLLGTTFGGNGTTNFALPDLRGRAPIHVGSSYPLGSTGGEERHTLTINELPPHTHVVNVDPQEATIATPGNTVYPAKTSAGTSAYANTGTTTLAVNAVSAQGGNQSHENMKPYVAMTCIISLQGIFPSRN
jgi:microcystin-dependent protein